MPDLTKATFDAKAAALSIAPLWPDYVKAHIDDPHEERFAQFIVQHAESNGWTMLQAFLVDYHFQEALDAYWKAQEDA